MLFKELIFLLFVSVNFILVLDLEIINYFKIKLKVLLFWNVMSLLDDLENIWLKVKLVFVLDLNYLRVFCKLCSVK